jgi:hypothetical protein
VEKGMDSFQVFGDSKMVMDWTNGNCIIENLAAFEETWNMPKSEQQFAPFGSIKPAIFSSKSTKMAQVLCIVCYRSPSIPKSGFPYPYLFLLQL